MTAAVGNVAGLVALRRSLLAWLEALPEKAWTPDVRVAVAAVADTYADALTGSLGPDQQATSHGPDGDPAGLVAELVRDAGAYEASFAEEADERWDSMPRQEFAEAGGTAGMGMSGVVLALHRAVHRLGRLTGRPVPVPRESQEAAAAAVAWLAGDKVEAPTSCSAPGR